MSTPCIIARVNTDKSIDAIAVRHDGYIDSIGYHLKKLARNHVDQLINCPYNEISGIVDCMTKERLIKEFPMFENAKDFERLGETDKYIHYYSKGSGDLSERHRTKEHTKYKDINDLEENGGSLEDWDILYVYDTDDKWYYKKYNGKKFCRLMKERK